MGSKRIQSNPPTLYSPHFRFESGDIRKVEGGLEPFRTEKLCLLAIRHIPSILTEALEQCSVKLYVSCVISCLLMSLLITPQLQLDTLHMHAHTALPLIPPQAASLAASGRS